MTKFTLLVASVMVLSLFAFIAKGQQHRGRIEVDGATLYLGMSKAEVAQKLAGKEYWKLNDDVWIMGGENKLAGPSIQFTNGRLSFAERFWATSENDTGMALFGAVMSLNNDGFRECEVTAGVNASPDETAHNVWILCGEKSVVVLRATIGDHSYTMVHEQLGRENVDKIK